MSARSLMTYVVVLWTVLGTGCTNAYYLVQAADPDLRALAKHGAGTVPGKQGLVTFEGRRMDDDTFVQAYPYLKRYGVTTLILNGTRVTDLSVSLLLQLDKLQTLYLRRCTGISAAGMKRLQQLPHLEQIVVNEAQLSDGELTSLREAMPQIRIMVWPR